MQIQAPISVGELIDKITILQIKRLKIKDHAKLSNIKYELDMLTGIWYNSGYNDSDIAEERTRLLSVNTALWEIEDSIREKESRKQFDDEFIDIARGVYMMNDLRSKIKREINLKLNSEIVEEKSYV